jgi:hypothetical protein
MQLGSAAADSQLEVRASSRHDDELAAEESYGPPEQAHAR